MRAQISSEVMPPLGLTAISASPLSTAAFSRSETGRSSLSLQCEPVGMCPIQPAGGAGCVASDKQKWL